MSVSVSLVRRRIIIASGLIPATLSACLYAAMRDLEVGSLPAEQGNAAQADMITRQAVCRWASKPPVLDGKLDDPCWQEASVIDHFAAYWNKLPRAGTRAYLVWDDQAVYYGASLDDAEVRAFGTQRNDTLWEGDVFELFLKPSADRPEYFEFQGNP